MTFVANTVRLVAWSAAAGLPVAALLFGWRIAIGIAGGLGLAIANAWALNGLTQTMFSPDHSGWWNKAGWWVMKIPVMYGLVGLLLLSPWSSPIGFLIGFSLWFGFLFAAALRSVYT